MSVVGDSGIADSIVNAQISEEGYLFINGRISFFTGDMVVNGLKQSFVLGIPVKYEEDDKDRRYARALNRPNPLETVRFLFDISDVTAIEMCIDGNDNDERYATYFYYNSNGICQHGVFSDLSGYNILVEHDYDSKGRIVRYYEHTGNWLTQIAYEQETAHIRCGHSVQADDALIKDIYVYPDGVIKGFIRISDKEVPMDNLKYVGDRKHRIIPGTNYDSLVWDIINFDMDDWTLK